MTTSRSRSGRASWWRGCRRPCAARRRVEEEPSVVVEGLEVDLAARVVRRDGEPVHLTPIEFDLLRVLVRNRGRLMTHRKLLAEVWGPEYVDDIQPLRTHIARLRAKIEPDGDAGPGTSSPTPASATGSPADRGQATPSRESLCGRLRRRMSVDDRCGVVIPVDIAVPQ